MTLKTNIEKDKLHSRMYHQIIKRKFEKNLPVRLDYNTYYDTNKHKFFTTKDNRRRHYLKNDTELRRRYDTEQLDRFWK